jgi:1-acyl-sn-glycerol-3-phosphate acyltransferase
VAELVYPPVIGLARTTWAAMGLRFIRTGTENVPPTGGAVMAINHTGYLDFTFAGYGAYPARRLVRFMAKQEIFHHPVAGPLMRGMKHIPVDRDAGSASYSAAVAALRGGEIVGVFPEATMSPSYELLPFKQGTARMAADAGVPILPTIIWGSQRVANYERHKPILRQRGVTITIAVGEPIVVSPDDGVAATTRLLRKTMEEMLHHAQETYPDSPSGPDDLWWVPARLGGTAVTPEEGVVLANARRKKSTERAAERAAGADAAKPDDEAAKPADDAKAAEG